jgi:Tfp pilus tip-associated adhesin PilY1
MIHAVDARTGFEVWAFIPFNLLPKLRTIRDGKSVEQFDYFVDSSPKIAEVKVDGTWKSLLIIGESMGGTFLQAFDVTEAGMAGPDPESDDFNGVLSTFQDANRIRFLWSFPDYSSFDTTYTGAFGVTDGWPGGKVKFYGDVKSTASAAEKTVGFTWSDPAVGPLTSNRSINVVVVGSGYFPAITLPARTGDGVGRTLYLLNAKTGRPLGSPSSCSTAATGIGCLTVDDVSDGRKNALQADPTAAGVPNGNWITKAYLGDIDGNYWRFDVTSTGQITKTALLPSRNANQPIYSSSALMLVGSLSQFIFFSTGSDLLPTTTSGGAGPFTLYGILDQGSSAIIKFSRPLAVDSSRGIVNSIERPSTSPSVAGDIVFFTTTTESFSAPCTDLSSNLYAFTYQGGAAYDTDNSGAITKNESPVVRTMSGRATAPFVVDQHLYVSTTNNTGVNIEAFGDPEDFNNGVGQVGVRILSWRELR